MLRHKTKAAAGAFCHGLNLPRPAADELLVVNLHRADVNELARMVERLSSRYDFPALNRVVDSIRSHQRTRATAVLTFDDGFSLHLPMAEWLAERNIGAAFFAVPDFTRSPRPEAFASSHIMRPDRRWSPREIRELLPLTQSQIAAISRMGHTVGSHTMSHNIFPGMSPSCLQYEIVLSRDWLEQAIQARVDCFAGPFSSDLLDERALELIAATYQFNFLTYPARSLVRQNLVGRTNVEPRWPTSVQEFSVRLNRLEELRYASRRNRLVSGWPAARAVDPRIE